MEVGEVLKGIRKEKGLTQNDVCKKTKITQTFLSQIEGGSKTPSPEMFKRICKFYGIPHQVVFWQTLTEKDIQKGKKEVFNQIKPLVDNLIKEFFLP